MQQNNAHTHTRTFLTCVDATNKQQPLFSFSATQTERKRERERERKKRVTQTSKRSTEKWNILARKAYYFLWSHVVLFTQQTQHKHQMQKQRSLSSFVPFSLSASLSLSLFGSIDRVSFFFISYWDKLRSGRKEKRPFARVVDLCLG